MLILSYRVENKRNEPVQLSVENYPQHHFGSGRDTIVQLGPGEGVTVGFANGIGFPWERKKLFREQPGMENFHIVSVDSLSNANQHTGKWRYRRGMAVFRIRD